MSGSSKLSKTFFAALSLSCLFLSLAAVPKAHATDYTIADSTASKNKARYLSLKNYPQTTSNWPMANQDGCSKGAGVLKAMPWLGDTDNLGGAGDPNFNSGNTSMVTGDTLTDAGNCNQRYDDGGTGSTDTGVSPGCTSGYFNGAWLCQSAYGGWTNLGSFSWGTACSTVGKAWDPSVYLSGRTPRIWGTCSPDQSDQSITLFTRNNPSYTPRKLSDGRDIKLFGIGSSIFRNEFNLAQADIDDLTADNLDPFLQIKADDWFAVYINGVPVASTTYTAGYLELSIPKYVFQAGQNVVAIQVIDKAYWNTDWSQAGDAAGLWYTLLFRGTRTPPITPISCTSFTASPSSILAGGSSTLSWATSGSPTGGTISPAVPGFSFSPNGSVTATNIPATTTYSLTFTKAGVSNATCSTTVNATGEPIGPGAPRGIGPWDSIINLPPVL